jgi:ribose 5-phosphate isomerase A
VQLCSAVQCSAVQRDMFQAFSRLSASRSAFKVTAVAAALALSKRNFQRSHADDAASLKKRVGYQSIDSYVRSGMKVGLGTGSTAYFAVERLGQRLSDGSLKDIVAVPTSEATRQQAVKLGVPLTTLDETSRLDVAIDGADEVDRNLSLVKGGGGALLREKLVEKAASKFVCIVDESKLCQRLGPGFPLPVEITPFCHQHTIRQLKLIPGLADARPVLRLGNISNNKVDGENIAVTDNGNYIVDIHFDSPIADAMELARQLKMTCGVVDHGLFVDMADVLIVGMKDGSIRVVEKGNSVWW